MDYSQYYYQREQRLLMDFNNEKIHPDTSVFSIHFLDAPKYKNPNYGNAYIKILSFIEHNETTLKECCNILFNGSNFDIFKTLVIYGFLEQIPSNKKIHRRFRITDRGKALLQKAEPSKAVFEFTQFINSIKPVCAEEIILNCTLHNNEQYLTNDNKQKIIKGFETYHSAAKQIKPYIMVVNEFLTAKNSRD